MDGKKTTIETLMEQGKTNGKLTTKEIRHFVFNNFPMISNCKCSSHMSKL